MLAAEDLEADALALQCLRAALHGRPPAAAAAASQLLRRLSPSSRTLKALRNLLQARP